MSCLATVATVTGIGPVSAILPRLPVPFLALESCDEEECEQAARKPAAAMDATTIRVALRIVLDSRGGGLSPQGGCRRGIMRLGCIKIAAGSLRYQLRNVSGRLPFPLQIAPYAVCAGPHTTLVCSSCPAGC